MKKESYYKRRKKIEQEFKAIEKDLNLSGELTTAQKNKILLNELNKKKHRGVEEDIEINYEESSDRTRNSIMENETIYRYRRKVNNNIFSEWFNGGGNIEIQIIETDF